MTDYEKICDFNNLYKAHCKARRGKRDTKEVIDFELNLSWNLVTLSDALRSGNYKLSGYYSFMVHDPKERLIHALHYRDRVLQHCLCDEVLSGIMEPRLIHDNAACRTGRGTHFAMERVTQFMRRHYRRHGTDGYILKCDIRKYFDSIDHEILKNKLNGCVRDEDVRRLLFMIIDSYEKTPGKGLPLGNQSSQWLALYYMDGLDRLVKEKLRIKSYSRYMDDCILLHHDKEYLKKCLDAMTNFISRELRLEFNEKTQIFPMRHGADYLGFHFYLTDSGKVIRNVRQQTKKKYKRKLKHFKSAYQAGAVTMDEVSMTINSYTAHLMHGHTYRLRSRMFRDFVLHGRPKPPDME